MAGGGWDMESQDQAVWPLPLCTDRQVFHSSALCFWFRSLKGGFKQCCANLSCSVWVIY